MRSPSQPGRTASRLLGCRDGCRAADDGSDGDDGLLVMITSDEASGAFLLSSS